MNNSTLAKSIIVSLCLLQGTAQADVRLSGFASVNAGKVLNGTGVEHYGVPVTFLADYPIVSAYEDEWSLDPESLFSLQIMAEMSVDVKAVKSF